MPETIIRRQCACRNYELLSLFSTKRRNYLPVCICLAFTECLGKFQILCRLRRRRRRRRAVNSLHFVTSTAAKHLYIVYASTSFHPARSRRCLPYSPWRVPAFHTASRVFYARATRCALSVPQCWLKRVSPRIFGLAKPTSVRNENVSASRGMLDGYWSSLTFLLRARNGGGEG